MVRSSYRANFTGDDGAPFFAMLFEAGGAGEPNDLRGGLRSPPTVRWLADVLPLSRLRRRRAPE
jgi:hypothetical protein